MTEEKFMETVNRPFLELPFDEVDLLGGSWGWGHGDGKYTISHVDENMNTTRYEVPKCICEMLEAQHKYGMQKVRSEIRRSLGI